MCQNRTLDPTWVCQARSTESSSGPTRLARPWLLGNRKGSPTVVYNQQHPLGIWNLALVPPPIRTFPPTRGVTWRPNSSSGAAPSAAWDSPVPKWRSPRGWHGGYRATPGCPSSSENHRDFNPFLLGAGLNGLDKQDSDWTTC